MTKYERKALYEKARKTGTLKQNMSYADADRIASCLRKDNFKVSCIAISDTQKLVTAQVIK